MSEEIRARKRALREQHRARRMAMTLDEASERSARIVQRCFPLCADAEHVALFWPMLERREVDLRKLDGKLRAARKETYYPWLEPRHAAGPLRFRLASTACVLVPHPLGFHQPPADAPEASEIDLIVAPALAATPRGDRLGYGAGHYDRALAMWPDARIMVVVYDFEVCDQLPVEGHDRAAQWVVSDERAFGPRAQVSARGGLGPRHMSGGSSKEAGAKRRRARRRSGRLRS